MISILWSMALEILKGNIKKVILFGAVGAFITFGYFIYRDYIKTKSANIELTEEKAELELTLESVQNENKRTIEALENKNRRLNELKRKHDKVKSQINQATDDQDGELAPVLHNQLKRMHSAKNSN